MIIATGQTVCTVLFVARVAQLEKLCLPSVRELPSAVVVLQTSTWVTSPVRSLKARSEASAPLIDSDLVIGHHAPDGVCGLYFKWHFSVGGEVDRPVSTSPRAALNLTCYFPCMHLFISINVWL